jgi:hypothetical protein
MEDDDMDHLRKLLEIQKAMMRDGLQVEDATAKTPLLAAFNLQVAQMYLMELLATDPDNEDATKSLEHVERAIELLHVDDAAYEH